MAQGVGIPRESSQASGINLGQSQEKQNISLSLPPVVEDTTVASTAQTQGMVTEPKKTLDQSRLLPQSKKKEKNGGGEGAGNGI